MANPHLVSISTVTTPAASNDLVSLADVKDELGITDSSNDAFLRRIISAVSDIAVQYCNRVLVAETLTDEFWPIRDPLPVIIRGGVAPLQLSRWPIVSVASVTENAVALTADVDFKVDAVRGQLHRLDVNAYPKPWAVFDIVVSYEGGFSTTPPALADAVIRLVKGRWFSRDRDPQLRSESAAGIYEAQYWSGAGPGSNGGLPPDIAAILDNYRVPVLATV